MFRRSLLGGDTWHNPSMKKRLSTERSATRKASVSLTVLGLMTSVAAGCGGTVTETTATGGAGGAGTGGSAGTTGTGGEPQGTCSPEEEMAAFNEPPSLGFAAPPSSPLTAVVVSVTDTSLEYNLGPDGGTETFLWAGPPLTTVFAQGDSVTVGAQEGWHFVAGSQIAAARNDFDFVPPDALPAVPMSKAPPLGYTTQCYFPEAGGGCGLPPASIDILALEVVGGTETVPVGSIVDVGGFQIHNAQSVALPGYGSEDCVVEALFMSGATVLGPVGK